ncbi:MAG: hypothetical protein ACFCU1_01020 [Sumerlaeia bacterium]
MSNTKKIILGCSIFAAVVIILVIGIFGYVGYSLYSVGAGIEKQNARLQQLNTTYAFAEPAATAPLDQTRFTEYLQLREDIFAELKNNPTIKKFADAMNNSNAQANQDLGAMDVFSMIGQIEPILEILANQLEKNQMSMNEFAYWKEDLVKLLYQSAAEGNVESQQIFNDLEKLVSSQSGTGVTTWNSGNQTPNAYLSIFGITQMPNFTEADLQIIEARLSEVKNDIPVLFIEFIFMQELNNQIQNQQFNSQTNQP